MAGRVIWEGTVSFGLVAIPIKMVSAVDINRVSFHLLRDENHARLERRMYCPKDEAVVPEEHIVKGYEIEPDKYVIVTDEEFESLLPERSDTIEILEFVEERDIDPIYFDRTYYLIPAKGGTKPYNLLTSILSDTSRLGISRLVLRDKEHLCAVKSIGHVLCLFILHYHEERIMPDDIAPRVEADEADVKRISDTIRKMSISFEPRKYLNEYNIALMEFIKRKARQVGTVETPEGIPKAEKPVDLISALEESLRKIKSGQAP